MSEFSNVTTQHKDLNPGEIARSEKKVNDCINALNNFINPFKIEDKAGLYNLSSGSKVPDDVETDLLRAEAVGKSEKNIFITERLEKKERFFDPIKKLKLKTVANTAKTVKVKSSKN